MEIDIRWVQTRLRKLGFNPGLIDGDRGPLTDAAIVEFKKSIGFQARPYIGPLTMAALGFRSHTATSAGSLPWLDVFERVRGMHEVRDNGFLSRFLRSDGRTLGDPSKLPWCGDLIETIFRLSLPDEPFPGALGQNPYWARNWALFGRGLSYPMFGCVGVWSRTGGGHVGCIVGQDRTSWYVDGGNQSNEACRVRISKTSRKLIAARWPATYPHKPEELPTMTPGDLVFSTNEA